MTIATDRRPRSESIGAEILRVVSAYEVVERTTASRDTAVHRLRAQAGRFDPEVMKVLTELLGLEVAGDETIEVPISRVCVDMIGKNHHLRLGNAPHTRHAACHFPFHI
jgi:hypothetical protein